jgi:hypothetical protein
MVSIHDSRLYVHSLQNIFIPQKGCIRRLLCQPGTLGSVSLHYQKSTSPSMVVVICKSACCTSTSIEELNGKCKSGAWREALSIREPPDVYIFFFSFQTSHRSFHENFTISFCVPGARNLDVTTPLCGSPLLISSRLSSVYIKFASKARLIFTS